MKFEVGKVYTVKLGRKHSGTVIKAKYIEYRKIDDSHVVQSISVVKLNGSIYLRDMIENGTHFIVGEEQINEIGGA